MMDPHDDVELSDLEDDAFIPDRTTGNLKGKSPNRFLRWIPTRMRTFLENMSRIRVRLRTVTFWTSKLMCHVASS